MSTTIINLSDLVTPPHTDFISGRDVGEKYAITHNILWRIENGEHITLVIDSSIRAINDSFIKGFFSSIFKKYKTYQFVDSRFTIDGKKEFDSLFKKNWRLLDIIYNERSN